MKIDDYMIDHGTGYCGIVVSIILASGDEVSEVAPEDHDLIGAVVLRQLDTSFAVIQLQPGGLVPMDHGLH